MLLSKLRVDPAKYQTRDSAWSKQTVEGIVAEGINPAKFGALPVVADGDSFVVAGDGHSRFEAVLRLAKLGTLPETWRRGADWDIPTQEVKAEQAKILAWTANLSRENLSPCEEAKVYRQMLDSGMQIEEAARLTHRNGHYIRELLPLNCLCHDIRSMVGKSSAAGGIGKDVACAMAERFQAHKVEPVAQQQLWHKVLKDTYLTPPGVKSLIDKLVGFVRKDDGGAMLFAMPENVEHTLRQMKDELSNMRRAARAIRALVDAQKAGILAHFAALNQIIAADGKRMAEALNSVVDDHGAQLVLNAIAA